MIGPDKIWDGNEWQQHIVRLLKIRYPMGDFQEVPDRHRGDFGIEGFSRDGRAYQCYSAEEPLETSARYENQRDKMSTDIKKFIDNKDDLTKVFGPLKIRLWVFAVPIFDSSLLVQHAEKKAAEVRAQNLTYAAADFCIGIVKEDDFAVELAKLLRFGLDQVHVATKLPEAAHAADWKAQNTTMLHTLEDKLSRVPDLTPNRRNELRETLLRHYLEGQEVLDILKSKYSEVFEATIRTKSAREAFLATHCLLTEEAPRQLLINTLKTFKEELLKFGIMTEQMAETLAHEAVTDWLMRCPLNFPQGAA